MKISISVSDSEKKLVDLLKEQGSFRSVSEVFQKALKAYYQQSLIEEYADGFKEFAESGEMDEWETTVGDGL